MIRIKRNPTDQATIDKLSISKQKNESGDIEYLTYIGDKIIGGLGFNIYKGYVTWVQIDTKYRRKGITSFLYKYVENDLNIKIDQPSPYLLNDGEKFWRSRLKKSNPADQNLLKKIQIQKELIKIPKDKFRPRNTYYTEYQILLNGKIIGKAQIKKNKNYISWIEIYKNFQRKGLSTYLYDYIEKDLEIKLRPSINQLDEGKEFWKSRND